METKETTRLGNEDWVSAALEELREKGAGGIKIVTLAKRMGVTSGSFYWHFGKLQDLLDAVLDHWEHRLTDHIIRDAISFEGPPRDRIWNLMVQVIEESAAEPDHAIATWAKSDAKVRATYERTLQRRYEFAAWMFSEAGFSQEEAETRGRLMVAYLMGESSTGLKTQPDWRNALRKQFDVLTPNK